MEAHTSWRRTWGTVYWVACLAGSWTGAMAEQPEPCDQCNVVTIAYDPSLTHVVATFTKGVTLECPGNCDIHASCLLSGNVVLPTGVNTALEECGCMTAELMMSTEPECTPEFLECQPGRKWTVQCHAELTAVFASFSNATCKRGQIETTVACHHNDPNSLEWTNASCTATIQ